VAQGNNNTKHLFILNPKSFWHKWKQTQVLSRIHGFFNTANNTNMEEIMTQIESYDYEKEAK
jgi:hypothetical protein